MAGRCEHCAAGLSIFLGQDARVWHSVCVSLTGEPEFELFECAQYSLGLDNWQHVVLARIRAHNENCPAIPKGCWEASNAN